jgi:hypothetical protein
MNPVVHKLSQNPLRKTLIHHEFFKLIKTADVSVRSAAIFIGQWWHPLHFFPDFLARAIGSVAELEMKTAISTILFQELGEGTPTRAHERVYIDTMTKAGFPRHTITDEPAFAATENLVSGYRKASGSPLSALGFVYGTEVADLVMVSAIGEAVRKATGTRELPWVDIHVAQEPHHVAQANQAVGLSFSADAEAQIERSAEEMWRLWIAFFSVLLDHFQSERQLVGVI